MKEFAIPFKVIYLLESTVILSQKYFLHIILLIITVSLNIYNLFKYPSVIFRKLYQYKPLQYTILYDSKNTVVIVFIFNNK